MANDAFKTGESYTLAELFSKSSTRLLLGRFLPYRGEKRARIRIC